MTRVLVIINPISGPARRGTPQSRVNQAHAALNSLGVRGDVRVTERSGHAHEIALQAAAAGRELVIVWGGDGTINEVGRALVEREGEQSSSGVRQTPSLGIVPGGSGNGLARGLGIPFDPVRAIARAVQAAPRRVDAGELGDRVFFNIAGIGLDAHVAALVSTRVNHRGFLPYLKGVAGDLLRYKPVEYAISGDGLTFRGPALFVAVANARQYGFGAEIAPRASLDDGLLDVVCVEDRSLIGNIARIPSLFTGSVDRRNGIQVGRVREVTVSSHEPMLFHVDGEAVQGSDKLVARVHPGALRLSA